MPKQKEVLTILAPDFQTLAFRIRGTASYAQHAWSKKAIEMIHETQVAGSTAKKGKAKKPKDFQADYAEAMHVSTEGFWGIPCSGIRKAMISACRAVGFQMTRAKLGILCVFADGHDRVDGQPLFRITKGKPAYWEAPVRVGMGLTDLRARPRWAPGWEAIVRIQYDAGMFSAVDVANLLLRAGLQSGIGEGRNDSPSGGIGYGSFEVVTDADEEKKGEKGGDNGH